MMVFWISSSLRSTDGASSLLRMRSANLKSACSCCSAAGDGVGEGEGEGKGGGDEGVEEMVGWVGAGWEKGCSPCHGAGGRELRGWGGWGVDAPPIPFHGKTGAQRRPTAGKPRPARGRDNNLANQLPLRPRRKPVLRAAALLSAARTGTSRWQRTRSSRAVRCCPSDAARRREASMSAHVTVKSREGCAAQNLKNLAAGGAVALRLCLS